jgi:hypothetical protein
VPTGGNVTPALLLGWGPAVCLDDEPEDVALAFADDAGDDDVDEDDPVLADDEAVPWVAVPEAAPVVEVELDDPPHAVSSSTSEPSPVATVHPLLRIASLSLPEDPVSRIPWGLPGTQPADVTSLAESLTTCHLPPMPLPFVLNAPAPLSV